MPICGPIMADYNFKLQEMEAQGFIMRVEDGWGDGQELSCGLCIQNRAFALLQKYFVRFRDYRESSVRALFRGQCHLPPHSI